MNDRGIIYVAVSERWAQEAVVSAQSAKAVMPDIPVSIFTDCPVEDDCFDSVEIIRPLSNPKITRIHYIMKTPYYRTLFLDTDTYFLCSVYDLFDLLDHFDVAVAHAPTRVTIDPFGIPACFPEFNAGVIAFRRTVLETLAAWKSEYEELGYSHDQPTFRKVLYESGLRIATLTTEYNCRPDAGYAWGEIKLIHARGEVLEKAKRLNEQTTSRVYIKGERV